VPEDSRVLRAHRLCTQLPIASTPGSSSSERLVVDNITSQPWSDATCPCTTSWSAYFRFVTLYLLKTARQSTRSGVTGARCLRLWLTRDIVWTGSFRRGWARCQDDRRLRTWTVRPQHPTIFLHFCRTFRSVRGPLQKLPSQNRYEKWTWHVFCASLKKGLENRSSRFEPKISWISFSRGSGPPLKTVLQLALRRNGNGMGMESMIVMDRVMARGGHFNSDGLWVGVKPVARGVWYEAGGFWWYKN